MNKSEIATGHAVAADFSAQLVCTLVCSGTLSREAGSGLLRQVAANAAAMADGYCADTISKFVKFFEGAADDIDAGRAGGRA